MKILIAGASGGIGRYLTKEFDIKENHLYHNRNQSLIDIRDSIEHVDERIRDTVDESPVLNISEDSLVIEVAARNQGKIFIKTKGSLRLRFGLGEKKASVISKLVTSAKDLDLIKNFDPNSNSKKYIKYVPIWA